MDIPHQKNNVNWKIKCKHEDETLMMTRWFDETGGKKDIIPEHVTLLKRCCDYCKKPKEVYEGVTIRDDPIKFESKHGSCLAELYTPLEFYMEYCKTARKSCHPGQDCDTEFRVVRRSRESLLLREKTPIVTILAPKLL